MATQIATRPTVRDDGSTSTWDAPRFAWRAWGTTAMAGTWGGSHLFYAFPSPQRTTRPGLPQQTRFPKAP